MPSATARRPRPEEAGDVEHRIVGEDDVVRRVRHHQRVGPELVRQAAMGEPHQLRRSGRAAGMHIGGDVVGLRRCVRTSKRRRAVATRARRSPMSRAARRPGLAPKGRCTASGIWLRTVCSFSQISKPGVGPSATTTFARDSRMSSIQWLRLEHPVDAARDAGRERAEHHGVELRDRRQQEQDRVVRRARRAHGTGSQPGSSGA